MATEKTGKLNKFNQQINNQKTQQMKTQFISVVILLGTIIASCKKEAPLPKSTKTEASPSQDKEDDETEAPTIAEARGTTISNANSANDIPSQFFKVATMYKNSYVHLHQYSGECSWTNYTLCAGAIARANGYTYAATHTKVTAVKSACISHVYGTPDDPAHILTINWYSGAHDYNMVNRKIESTNPVTGRFEMIQYMLNHINNHHTPFLALAVDPGSGVGHYLTVWSIDWKVGGSGSTIYYTNTLASNGSTLSDNLKSTSLTKFLDWMRDNPQANNYNCLFVWNK